MLNWNHAGSTQPPLRVRVARHPRVGTTTLPHLIDLQNLGILILNIFSLQICFSFQDECLECGPILFTTRFRFKFPKFRFSDFKLSIYGIHFGSFLLSNFSFQIFFFKKHSFMFYYIQRFNFNPPQYFLYPRFTYQTHPCPRGSLFKIYLCPYISNFIFYPSHLTIIFLLYFKIINTIVFRFVPNESGK